MTAPGWLNSVLQEFGKSIGLTTLGFNDRNSAVLHFETGVSLRFEYAFETMVIAMMVPAPEDPEVLQHLLLYAQPERRPASFTVRVSYIAKSSCAMIAARIPEREVSLPVINMVFTELWHLAEDFRGRLNEY